MKAAGDALAVLKLELLAAGRLSSPGVTPAGAHAALVALGHPGDPDRAAELAAVTRAFGETDLHKGVRRANGGFALEMGTMSQAQAAEFARKHDPYGAR